MKVDFQSVAGKIKPMHATNNGPVVLQQDVQNGTLHPFNNNLEPFKAAGIPYARPNEFWNGMFDDTVVGRVLKGYYPFPNFTCYFLKLKKKAK